MSNKHVFDHDILGGPASAESAKLVDAALRRAEQLGQLLFDGDEDAFADALPAFLAMPKAKIDMNAEADDCYGRGSGDGTGGDAVTLLDIAIQERLPRSLSTLISAGADLASRDILGETPLHGMILPGSDNGECLRIALAAGANPSAPDKYGMTPLHMAMARGKTGAARDEMSACSALLAAGADIFAVNHAGDDPMAKAFQTTSSNFGAILLLEFCPENLLGRLIESARAANEIYTKNGGATWALVEAWVLANAAAPGPPASDAGGNKIPLRI